MALTKEDFQNLEEKFVTKDEFNERHDKLDRKFDEKYDNLDKKHDKLVIEVLDIKERLNGFVTIEKFDKKMNEILTVLDGIAKVVGSNEAERASNIVAHDRFEKRIARTEKELNLEPIYS
jgi:hypothetical protein